MTDNSLVEIAAVLRNASSVLVASHRSPEGDALGSSSALALALEALGKRVVLFNADPCPASLGFLPGLARLTAEIPSEEFDAAVICDVSEPERVADEFERRVSTRKWIVIDHHRTERPFGDLRHNDPDAPATSELVLALFDAMGVTPSSAAAECLYTGIAVDTGNFRFSNAGERAFRAAARLTAAGVDASEIAHRLFEELPVSKLRLTAAALNSLEFALGAQVAAITVDRPMLEACEATLEELDGLVNYPRSLRGCKVAVQFYVPDDGPIRVSLRTSHGQVDVEAVARHFGGGGHKHAAGCSVEGTTTEVKASVFDAIGAMLARIAA